MAKNNFKPFAIAAGANVTIQLDWEALPALASGFQSGKASSAQVNKALRQATFIAAALAQFVSEQTGSDVLDDGELTGFVAKISEAIDKKVNGYLDNGFLDDRIQSQVQAWMTNALAGTVGTSALLNNKTGNHIAPGNVIPGSQLRWASAGEEEGAAPEGSWRALGTAKSDGGYDGDEVTLFVRIN